MERAARTRRTQVSPRVSDLGHWWLIRTVKLLPQLLLKECNKLFLFFIFFLSFFFYPRWRIEAVFEVNTDLQKNVQAKITAHLNWPSLVNSSKRITFPLTNTNSSSVSGNHFALICTKTRQLLNLFFNEKYFLVFLQNEVVILQNPADVPVYVQVLPLALLPNPSVFSGKLADRFEKKQNKKLSQSLMLHRILTRIYFAGFLWEICPTLTLTRTPWSSRFTETTWVSIDVTRDVARGFQGSAASLCPQLRQHMDWVCL